MITFCDKKRYAAVKYVPHDSTPARILCQKTYEEYGLRSFLTRELRACARASYRYDVGNGIRSLARSIGRFL